jgi:hypothetical protein
VLELRAVHLADEKADPDELAHALDEVVHDGAQARFAPELVEPACLRHRPKPTTVDNIRPVGGKGASWPRNRQVF